MLSAEILRVLRENHADNVLLFSERSPSLPHLSSIDYMHQLSFLSMPTM